jgi:hypothetical protein
MTPEEYREHFRHGFDDGRKLASEVRTGELGRDSGARILLDARRNVHLFGEGHVPYSTGVLEGWIVDSMAYGDPI